MKNIRCDSVIVQIIATEYDDLGRPIGETPLPAMKLFRASTRDFWPSIDKALDEAKTRAATAQTAETPAGSPKKGGKRR